MTPLQEALAPKSDQLNSDDLIAGSRTIKITEARILDGGRESKKITVHFEGDNGKPWKPCKTMGRAMVMVWGITDEAQFAGKSVTLYRDPDISFGDQKNIGGIRISHMSHIDKPKTVKLTVSQGKKGQFVFQPLTAEVRKIAPDKPKKTPEEWVAEHIGAIKRAPDLSTLDDFVGKRAAAIDRLSETLAGLCQDAYDARRIELAMPADDPVTEDDLTH